MRQHFDWPAALIDRVPSQMQHKKEKLSERISLTRRMEARVDPNTWARIEKDRERERDGKGGKESGRSPEAREMGFHVEGQ